MIRGLVIGKFMPVHAGHVALINFAASSCDELIVSMSYTEEDPIKHTLRFHWLKSTFENRQNITFQEVVDDFDNEALKLPERTRAWAAFIEDTCPKVDVVFSSESYGEPFAINLGAKHVLFDLARTQFPISGTKIREKPFRHWQFIPKVVRPFFLKKVCFFGAESTGKSTMAMRVAEHYNTEYVPEVAREIVTSNRFDVSDILRIGEEQAKRVLQKSQSANKVLICDTDVITTQIYSQQYLHHVPEQLLQYETEIKYDRYFLFDIDTPWVADGLRDLGNRRGEMNQKFIELITLKLNRAQNRCEALIVDDARKRVIDFLKLNAQHKEKKIGFEMLIKHSMTQQDIANYTGTSRQTVTSILNDLRKSNKIYFKRNSILWGVRLNTTIA